MFIVVKIEQETPHISPPRCNDPLMRRWTHDNIPMSHTVGCLVNAEYIEYAIPRAPGYHATLHMHGGGSIKTVESMATISELLNIAAAPSA